MKRITLAAVLMFGVFVTGCASFPKDDIEIATEANPTYDFSAYQTYSWIGSAAVLNDPEGTWEAPGFDTDSLVTALINKQLAAHGLKFSDTGGDTLVAYAIGADMAQMKFEHDPTTDVEILKKAPQSALVVVLLDAETEVIAWAAVAVADVQNKGDEVMKKRINYAINEMFKQFPKK
ncbi:MAG: DUF4136 domain-containing protein [Burkholderiales bacterium]